MYADLLTIIDRLNPWLKDPSQPIVPESYIPREQAEQLLSPEWDNLWLILTGPRQAGKTTLGLYLSHTLIQQGRFDQLLYLNCDYLEIRQWLRSAVFIDEAKEFLQLKNPIIFIDEVQRLENPGLVLKQIADLKLPIKMLASGSSQLEIKSKVQEFLTGRQLESLVLPLSYVELPQVNTDNLLYGCYPAIVKSNNKAILLQQLYQDYINKDIIEILKVRNADILQKLLGLVAHSSGQLVNYQQLASDSQVTIATVQHYLGILEATYVIYKIKPFVGNKRKEITSNPIYYFIDNGFRNQTLRNFAPLEQRTDVGFLAENAVFQELLKFKTQNFYDFDLHYWRTNSGAEVDFILYKNTDYFIPIEVKYQHMKKPQVTRAFRSFVEAYQPKFGIFVTKDFFGKSQVENCEIHFVPLAQLTKVFSVLKQALGFS